MRVLGLHARDTPGHEPLHAAARGDTAQRLPPPAGPPLPRRRRRGAQPHRGGGVGQRRRVQRRRQPEQQHPQRGVPPRAAQPRLRLPHQVGTSGRGVVSHAAAGHQSHLQRGRGGRHQRCLLPVPLRAALPGRRGRRSGARVVPGRSAGQHQHPPRRHPRVPGPPLPPAVPQGPPPPPPPPDAVPADTVPPVAAAGAARVQHASLHAVSRAVTFRGARAQPAQLLQPCFHQAGGAAAAAAHQSAGAAAACAVALPAASAAARGGRQVQSAGHAPSGAAASACPHLVAP
mmetsp:Transcript_1297/g.3889  ORF Transcript_1297/g.3889 Transcript_1297/m.3889 type:complete len:288 (+) Transcript_1297:660-1523(+)